LQKKKKKKEKNTTMLRIAQRTLNSTPKRQFGTLVERQIAATNNMRLVKNHAHIALLASAAIKRQQPGKWVALYHGSKRFYNGKF
jgi:hypothetical protein